MSKIGYREKCLRQKLSFCNICGDAEEPIVHHIDGNRDNNELKNLLPVCRGCHQKIHSPSSFGEKIDAYTERLPESALISPPTSALIDWDKCGWVKSEVLTHGKVTIPKTVREALDIEKGDVIELDVTKAGGGDNE